VASDAILLAQLAFELEGGDEGFLSAEGTRSGLIALAGLILSFRLIRVNTRLMRSPKIPWWPGSIESGDLHVHHLVFGNVMVLFFGFVLALSPGSPWLEIAAAGFGIGAGLTLDEFALWLHLDDVYWAEEGRRSVDAVAIASAVAGLLLVGFLPFGTQDSWGLIIVSVLFVLTLTTITVLKGKVILGVASMFFAWFGIFGAIRLARPGSIWAGRFYKPGSRELAEAEKRFARHTRRYQRFQDRIAGAPDVPVAEGAPEVPGGRGGG
jgi:hypothetical protein